tara:strand:+ start:224 stop:469 length:246 start_codon:yes stop_codon:yes gene_type:complete
MALGLGLSTVKNMTIGGGATAAAVIEDYVFELSSGNLQPRDIDYDFSDAWDVSATEITPASSPIEEGYFDIDGNGDLQPKE